MVVSFQSSDRGLGPCAWATAASVCHPTLTPDRSRHIDKCIGWRGPFEGEKLGQQRATREAGWETALITTIANPGAVSELGLSIALESLFSFHGNSAFTRINRRPATRRVAVSRGSFPRCPRGDGWCTASLPDSVVPPGIPSAAETLLYHGLPELKKFASISAVPGRVWGGSA